MSTQILPPPYQITPDDKRGLVVVVTAVTLAFVWTCLLIRLYLRLKVREWKLDDYLLGAATIFDSIQSGVVFSQVDNGFGETDSVLNADDLREIGKGDLAQQILYIITLLLSKSAIIFLYLRLSPARRHKLANWGTLVVSAIWAILSIVLVSAPCNSIQFWTSGPGQCKDLFTRWQAITAIDIMTETAIFLISIYLVEGLNMALRSKAMVVGAFSSRLPVIAASAIRLYYLRQTLASPNPSLSAAYPAVATQWHLGYAIMSSTISSLGPFLRPFSRSYSTSYRHTSSAPSTRNDTHVSASAKSARSFQLSSLQSAAGRPMTIAAAAAATVTELCDPLALRPDRFVQRSQCRHERGEGGAETDQVSLSSSDSKRLIITKKTMWSVEHDRVSVVEGRSNASATTVQLE
ncbi:hypothetical protein AOQ84DRAFT_325604 [Glonium stellatum]|uniref:Rhodopsin domain-containing protein n=1 Tax=Glonium stellatum TaxID=574774 RepID=A0A8E2ERN4_9PEZI|nr:hypothetical protein AOQ84DRAFT_325604 [Glonium stellatum]